MIKRPISISVIAWVLIVMGGISLITTTAMINNPLARDLMSKSSIPLPVQYAMSYIGLLIMIVSGSAMLKGFNWSQFLYIIWNIIAFLIGAIASSMKMAMIPGLVVFLLITFFLFQPKANSFFSPKEENINA